MLVELKARFDEENNIVWAKKLEQAGCHVIYGLVGLKTHCKIALVVRREEEGIVRYVHLGTGNYNDSTAKQYTDCGMFTCSEMYGQDATAVFNMLSGILRARVLEHAGGGADLAAEAVYRADSAGDPPCPERKEGLIVAKMNSLCDKGNYRESLRGFGRRRKDLSDRPGYLLPAHRYPPVSARIFMCAPSWALSWSTAGFSISTTTARKISIWEAPTGCRETWTAG